MRKSLKRVTGALLVFVAIPTMAFAATYSNTFSFSYYLEGATRSYSAGGISIQTLGKTESCSGAGRPQNNYFKIELYKEKIGKDELIGSVNHSRYNTQRSTFSGVSSGKYYFAFQKADDFCTVKGRANMYNE